MTITFSLPPNQLSMTGGDRVRFLHGMCTANIESMKAGDHRIACFLNAKGRVRATADILFRDEDILLICDAAATLTKLAEILKKHAIMDDVAVQEIALPAHRSWQGPQQVFAPPVLAPAPEESSPQDIEGCRIAGGRPLYDQDITEDNFPFEGPLGQFVDYDKGCYIGQEPVSRVHFKGQPSKTMRGLRFTGDVPATGGTIVHPEKAKAGALTSVVDSATYGAIGLGYLHRSCDSIGDTVTIAGCEAVTCELPMPG